MNRLFDVVVIGSGPSGFACAITAARRGKSVALVERNDKLAKKLYATGNGRCNFLNTKSDYYDEAIEFAKSCGIVGIEEEDGRLYPRNKEASSVVNCLTNAARMSGTEFILSFETASVQKIVQGFSVKSKTGDELICQNVVVATGGKAGIQFGCYGDGYKWAESFGINVIKPIPALCGLEVKENLSILAGTRVFARALLFKNNELVAEDTGEVQFTNEAVSGICVMNLARYIRLEEGASFSLHLDLYPEHSSESLFELFMDQKRKAGCAMEGLVPEKMHSYLHTRISKEQHSPKTMAALSKDLAFNVVGTKGWKDAQVTCGGVDFGSLDENYQSKANRGLFFTGEVLNYDGPCGGYNIGFALASGVRVGNAIK